MSGAYTTDRAAALAGVPLSTLRRWCKTELVSPSISPTRVALWSHEDLLKIRIIEWLRVPKNEAAASRMPLIRAALTKLDELGADVSEGRLRVDQAGRVYLVHDDGVIATPTGQTTCFDPIAPFKSHAAGGLRGPDLLRPRPHLRIVPGKLGGAPHAEGSRIETRALAALAADGFDVAGILRLYPALTGAQVKESLDLERQLERNLRSAA